MDKKVFLDFWSMIDNFADCFIETEVVFFLDL